MGPKISAPAPWKLGVLAQFFGNGATSVKWEKTGRTGEGVSEAKPCGKPGISGLGGVGHDGAGKTP